MEEFEKLIPMQEYIEGFRDPERVRGYCRSCNRHSNCWACPPFGFDEELLLNRYGMISVRAVKLYPECGGMSGVSPEEIRDVLGETVRTYREKDDARLLKREESSGGRAFFAGTCLLCPQDGCSRIYGRPCVHPEKVRPSLEAFGFDMEATASRLFGIEMKWGAQGRMPEYLTLVSGLAFVTRETAESL